MFRSNLRRRSFVVVFMVLLLAVSAFSVSAEDRAKSVILLIGDGMATSQRTLAYYFLGSHPVMNQMSVVGMFTNHMADGYITDSAASGTAMSTGVKTYDGAVGVDAAGNPVETILEAARDAGKATGLVSTSRINHATPASFAAHEASRNNYEEIMADFLEARVDVLLGAGTRYCLPKDVGGTRSDGRNLLEEFSQNGYKVITSVEEMAVATEAPVLGLFTSKDLTPDIDRDPSKEPSLAEMTKKAIDLLSKDEDGFFLMVEGSQIDWAGHDNDAAKNVRETIAFDNAVAMAMAYAAKNRDTLVIVTADHETGALTIGDNYHFDPVALRKINASASRIAGLINSDKSNLDEVFAQYAGLELTDDERALLKEAGDLTAAVNEILNFRVGVLWHSENHSGVMIPLSAEGAGAELFAGFYDNTDIPQKVAEAMGIEF